MNYSINDVLRNEIIDKNSIENSIQNINDLEENKRKEVVSLFLSDYVKLKAFNHIINGERESLNNFDNYIEDIKQSDIFDETLLKVIIKSSNTFNSLSSISKIILFDTISKYVSDESLNSISNLHLIDKLNYQFDYNLESFKRYYIDFKNKNNLAKSESVSEFIARKLIKFSEQNFSKYKSFIISFIEIYYKWTLFAAANLNKDSLYQEDYIYLNLINLSKVDTLVKYSLENFNFLKTIIDGYLFYSTSYKEISEPIVDKYYNNIDKNLKFNK